MRLAEKVNGSSDLSLDPLSTGALVGLVIIPTTASDPLNMMSPPIERFGLGLGNNALKNLRNGLNLYIARTSD